MKLAIHRDGGADRLRGNQFHFSLVSRDEKTHPAEKLIDRLIAQNRRRPRRGCVWHSCYVVILRG